MPGTGTHFHGVPRYGSTGHGGLGDLHLGQRFIDVGRLSHPRFGAEALPRAVKMPALAACSAAPPRRGCVPLFLDALVAHPISDRNSCF